MMDIKEIINSKEFREAIYTAIDDAERQINSEFVMDIDVATKNVIQVIEQHLIDNPIEVELRKIIFKKINQSPNQSNYCNHD